MSLINKFKKAVVYPLVASMLLSGCASASYKNYGTQNQYANSRHRVTFVSQNPRTLNDIISATKETDKAIRYTEKFNDIKIRLQHNPSYNPRDDLRALVWDVENSDLRQKYGLSNSFKDFSYYKEDKIVRTKTLERDGLEDLLIYGGLFGILAMGVNKGGDEGGASNSTIILGGLGIIYLGQLLLNKFCGSKSVEYINKTLVRPYY